MSECNLLISLCQTHPNRKRRKLLVLDITTHSSKPLICGLFVCGIVKAFTKLPLIVILKALWGW